LPTGASAPTGCYDLLADPDKRIACDQLTEHEHGTRSRRSSRIKRFPIEPRALDAQQARVHKQKLERKDGLSPLRIVIEVAVADGWREVWRKTINSAEQFTDGSGQSQPMPVRVTVWPNLRRDRALVLVENEDTAPGTGFWDTTVHWVDLPADLVDSPAKW
jgi:hypothetical protein